MKIVYDPIVNDPIVNDSICLAPCGME